MKLHKIESPMKRRKKTEPVKKTMLYYSSWREHGLSEEFVRTLERDLLEWALNDPDALVIGDFYSERGFHKSRWYDWIKKYPNLGNAWDVAKALIAGRREKGALQNTLNAAVVIKWQALYDDEVLKLEERRALLRSQESASLDPLVIELPPIENSPLVPKRHDEQGE